MFDYSAETCCLTAPLSTSYHCKNNKSTSTVYLKTRLQTGKKKAEEKQLSFPLYVLYGVFIDSTRLIEFSDLNKGTLIQSYFIFKPLLHFLCGFA